MLTGSSRVPRSPDRIMTCCQQLAVIAVALILSTPIVAATDINELADQFGNTDRIEQRLEILRQVEVEVRGGNLQAMSSRQIAGLALSRDVASASESMSLLRTLLGSPAGRQATVLAIGGRLSDSRIDSDTARRWIELLIEYDKTIGLPDSVFKQMGGALGRLPDPTYRQHVFSIVSESSWAQANRDELLSIVAGFLEPRFSREERLGALGLLGEAARDGTLPAQVRTTIYRVATQDENARLRVSAWPILIATASEEDLRHLRMTLTREIQSPDRALSLYSAEPQVRDDGVRIIANMWKPGLPDMVIDGLIGLVGTTGSISALRELADLRRVDGLNEQQLARLRALDLPSPEGSALLETLLIDALQPGSLIGPMEAIEHSMSPEVRRLATEQLLEAHSTDPVPVSVAEAAYSVLRRGGEAGSPAIDLVVRADEPFATKEKKILALIDQAPQMAIVDALSKLNDGADAEYLVQAYATDQTIAETFRSSLVSALHRQTANGGELRPETLQVLRELGESASNYFTIGRVIRVFENTGEPVPWSIRIRSSSYQWDVLFISLIVSWIIAIAGGILWLLLIAFPSDAVPVSRGSRIGSLVGWLAMAVVFVVSSGAAMLYSLGHSEAPKPGPAVPFYVSTLFLACGVAAISIYKLRKRSKARRDAAMA